VKLFQTPACDAQSLVMGTETGGGELGGSRVLTSGLVGGKDPGAS